MFAWDPDLIQLRKRRNLVWEPENEDLKDVFDEDFEELVLGSVLMPSEWRDYFRDFEEVMYLCPTSFLCTLYSYAPEIALVKDFCITFQCSTWHAGHTGSEHAATPKDNKSASHSSERRMVDAMTTFPPLITQ